MQTGPSVLRAFALSLAAGVCGSILGGFLLSLYLAFRWSFVPFGGGHPDPLALTLGAIPLITLVTAFIGTFLAVPIALMIGPAVVLGLHRPIRLHFSVTAPLLTVAFGGFGTAVAFWLDLGDGMDMPAGFVSAGVALTLCWLVKRHVADEIAIS